MQRLKVKGFTLIEVLIALIIIAIALLGVTSGVNNTIRGTTHLGQQMTLNLIAQNLFIRCNTGELPLVDAAKNPQKVTMLGRTFIGTITIEDEKKAADKISISVAPELDPTTKYTMQAIVAKRISFDDDE